MKRYMILAAILGLAATLYVAGFATGAISLFAAGALFEAAFWIKLMRKPRPVRIVIKRDEPRRRR
ncbi:hypothetical protein FIV34_07450 [Luteibacter pinisoli]|jgi:hypothetical protein|uniref:Uncharacterized protein n=1 Tax=Luteibacter pinisoli TaxID=2589080 RepID=A0A4Y5Z2D9_9GAMM|nr:hypothetical protein [Luteibacter pinisoli]QDE39046.1 hypothetical protein FIV34_07450 [Luteibacter pinisoli]